MMEEPPSAFEGDHELLFVGKIPETTKMNTNRSKIVEIDMNPSER